MTEWIFPGLFATCAACVVVCVAQDRQKHATVWWFATMGWALVWKLEEVLQ